MVDILLSVFAIPYYLVDALEDTIWEVAGMVRYSWTAWRQGERLPLDK